MRNNYLISIKIGRLGGQNPNAMKVVHEFYTKDVEPPYVFESGDHSFTFRDGMIFYKDDDSRPIYGLSTILPDEAQFYTELDTMEEAIAVIERQLEVHTHPLNVTCGECKRMDRKTGVEILTRQTHTFENGTYGFTETLLKYAAMEMKSDQVRKDTVGYCAPINGLVDQRAPACETHFEPLDEKGVDDGNS